MAAITGIPNFYTQPGPLASDFNNAAKAICTQLGGTYYDEAQSAYVSAVGNLDSANISANAQFRNYQKTEPYSWSTVTGIGQTVAATTISGFTCYIPFAPFNNQVYLIGVAFNQMDATNPGTVSGSVDMYFNGAYFKTFNFAPSSTGDALAPMYTDLGVLAGVNDWVYFDFTNLSGWGNGTGLPVATAKYLVATISLKMFHTAA